MLGSIARACPWLEQRDRAWAKLCFIGQGLMENRSGLIVDARLTRVSGHAERLAALEMLQNVAGHPCAITLGADRGYDAADFVWRSLRRIVPQVAPANWVCLRAMRRSVQSST